MEKQFWFINKYDQLRGGIVHNFILKTRDTWILICSHDLESIGEYNKSISSPL